MLFNIEHLKQIDKQREITHGATGERNAVDIVPFLGVGSHVESFPEYLVSQVMPSAVLSRRFATQSVLDKTQMPVFIYTT